MEYLSTNIWLAWVFLALLCLILELLSGDFFIICFSIGAGAATLAGAVGLAVGWQIFVFAGFSLLSVLFIRPVVLRYFHKKDPNRSSNADALMDRRGKVTKTIKAGESGYVQIDGDQWKAVSTSVCDIPEGTTVIVVGRKSTILTVEML